MKGKLSGNSKWVEELKFAFLWRQVIWEKFDDGKQATLWKSQALHKQAPFNNLIEKQVMRECCCFVFISTHFNETFHLDHELACRLLFAVKV